MVQKVNVPDELYVLLYELAGKKQQHEGRKVTPAEVISDAIKGNNGYF
jgi:hypothetical protein